MATPQQLQEAIRRADAAGDAASVRALGAELRRQQQATPAQKPTSFWQGVGEEMTRVARRGSDFLDGLNPVNALANSALSALGVNMNKRTQAVRQANDAAYAASPNRGSAAGKVVGGIAASLPTLAIPGGPVVQGAASGALLSHSNNAAGIAKDAAIGAVLGKIGDVGTKAVGRAIGGGNVSKNVRLLANEGVTMTPGMRAGPGSVRNFVEDKVLGTVAPWIPNSAVGRAENQLRHAVANRVLSPIGESIPRGAPINNEAMSAIQNKVYGALDDAAGNLSLAPDAQLAQDLAATAAASPRMLGSEGAQQVDANIAHLNDLMDHGALSGDTLRETLGELRGLASSDHGQLGQQIWALHDNLVDAMARQNPSDALAAFNSAREATALLKRMESAASKSVNGEFGPTQLLQAARQRGYGTTTGNVANGEARLMDLANAAADVMRNKTPNSGTASRAIAASLLGGGGLAALKVNPVGGAVVGSQLLGYVPGIADVLQRIALNRPQVLQQAGSALQNAAPLIGYGTAAAAPNLLAP